MYDCGCSGDGGRSVAIERPLLNDSAAFGSDAGSVMWPMPSGKWLRLTVPSKCGTTRWGQLVMLVETGMLPTPLSNYSPRWLLSQANVSLARLRVCDMPLSVLSSQVVWLFVVRSPYTRFLSGYLDKGAPWFAHKDYDHSVTIRGTTAEQRKLFTASPEGFAHWARWLSERRGWENKTHFHNMNLYAKLHFWPIMAAWQKHAQPALDLINSPSPWITPRIVKQEEMYEWFPPLVDELGIRSQVLKSVWTGGCFYSAPNASCADTLNAQYKQGAHHGHRRTKQICATTKEQFEKHNTGSCARLLAFYTPEVADLVSDMYRTDLEAFNYPRWQLKEGSASTSLPW